MRAVHSAVVVVLACIGIFSAKCELVAQDQAEPETKLEAGQANAERATAVAHADIEKPHEKPAHGQMARDLPLISVLPFAILLLCIAVLPLFAGHWWEHNFNKAIVSIGLAIPIALYFLAVWGEEGRHDLVDKVQEYVSFILLLGALYIISGGIYIKGSLAGTPLSNAGMMTIGALLASFIGTTGASVLLIRPLLRANKTRRARAHIVIFFIFIVSNSGGLLTPLGDPPLFLGFLKGVPFFWTFERLWPEWLVVNFSLLAIFHIYDQVVFDREERARHGSQLEEVMKHEPLGIAGAANFLFLGGVVAIIYAAGKYDWPYGVAQVAMAALAMAAYLSTPRWNHTMNKFTFGPIVEVAVLFIGIFITMAPALQILNAWGQGQRPELGPFGLTTTWHYFWATGLLSSVLDNAPTYLTMAATAAGQAQIDAGPEGGLYLANFIEKGGNNPQLLAAISCGAVFMGANTYIGNGPNFMVKAIAEEDGVHMPSFFGYMTYSGAILIPLFVVVTLIFFRG